MQTNIIAILALAGYATAGCFSGGYEWHNRNQAAAIARSACELSLSGKYGPESAYDGQRSSCANTPTGKMDMIITHIKEDDRDLSPGECYDGLQKEIFGCSHGGYTRYTNWAFK